MARATIATLLAAVLVALAAQGPPASLAASGQDAGSSAGKLKCKKKGTKPRRGKRKRCRPTTPAPAAVPPASPGTPQSPGRPPEPSLDFSFSSDPPLLPGFAPAISDYVVRCDPRGPTTIGVEAADGTSVAVDGVSGTGRFAQDVPLEPGQSVTVTGTSGGTERDHHVRCLPSNFPGWSFERFAQPGREFYVVSPTRRLAVGEGRYVVVLDDQGVPIWWFEAPVSLADAKVLSDGSLAWGHEEYTGYEIRDLDGTLTRVASFAGSETDPHDLQEVGNGNLLVMSYKPRAETADLSAYGGSATASVRDAEIQEIDPTGAVVWSWNSKDHIGLDEVGDIWWQGLLRGDPHDLVHLNSIEPSGDSVIISLRRTDAVYGIDRATGEIEWKLGGTTTPESLTVVGDPHGDFPLAGQHDARILSDGTLTVHDNGSGRTRPPRALRYEIDEANRTATLVESVTDPLVSDAGCCGGARRNPDGSWVMSWGQVPLVTEFAADGSRAFSLRFGGEVFSYRAFPVPDGLLTREALRAGMEAMSP